jgi:uracil-DNA glycosylase family 4
MDGREQLRRYLEQRRDAGEQDLVLDQMKVEDVLALLGARPAPAGERKAPVETTLDQGPRTETADVSEWRDVLRRSGASPDKVVGQPAVRETSGPPTPHAPQSPPTPPTPPTPLTPPSSRADEAAPAMPPPGLSVGTANPELTLTSSTFAGPMAGLDSLDAIAQSVASCKRCPLYATALNPVPGQGNPNAALMIVGEAPGATEDEQGLAFVGAAGQLLTKILAAVELNREDVFICNVLKHRPPGNRNPMPDEVTACSPYLVRQFELIRPRAILALGTFAAQTLLETKLSIGKLRSQVHRYYGVPLIVTYHPAALLRNPSWKRPTWEDVQLVRRILDRSVPQS